MALCRLEMAISMAPRNAAACIGRGTTFKMDPLGSVTVLHFFGNPEDPSEGSGPSGTLIEASDGHLYGTTVNGGMNFGGTVFRMDTDGNVQVVIPFVRLREGEISWPQGRRDTDGGRESLGHGVLWRVHHV